MCRGLVSCADLKPFWRRLVKLFETVTPPSKRMDRQTTPSIAGQTSLYKSLSPQQEKSRIAIKNNSSIKPNKFHSKYVCFGGRKTHEERKICLKIYLFGFPETLVTRHVYSAANDPQTGNDPHIANDPQIGPQMIPNRKWSRRKTRNGMEFVPPVEVSIFNINRSKS